MSAMRSEQYRARARCFAGLVLATIVSGCSQPEAVKIEDHPIAVKRAQTPTAPPNAPATPPAVPTPPKPARVAETPATSDPQASAVGYLKHVGDKTKELTQYRVTFIRQERLGVVPVLRKEEKIAAAFRAEPFSVHFKWLETDSEYAQAAFVRGQNQDKVLLLPRKGLLGLPATVGKFNPQDAVTFQKSRNPITDFGLARMMERTLKRIEDAERGGGATVVYRGVEPAGTQKRPAHRFSISLPKSDPYTNKQMELFIDQQTELPLGAYMRLPDGKLDAMYLYEDVQTDVQFSAPDFEIHAGTSGKTNTASSD